MPSKSQFICILLLSFLVFGVNTPRLLTKPHSPVNKFNWIPPRFVQGNPWSVLWRSPDNDSFLAITTVMDTIFAAGFTVNESDLLSFGRNVLLVKYSTQGFQLWNKTWRTPYDAAAYALDASGSFVYLVGVTSINGNTDGFLSIVNFEGTSIRNVTWGTANDEEFTGVALGSDGVYVSGVRRENGVNTTALLVRFNFNGDVLWNETWNPADFSSGTDVAVTTNEVYLVGFYENKSTEISENLFLVRYSSSGLQMWNATWGGEMKDRALGVTVFNNSIFVTGTTHSYSSQYNSDLLLLKYNRTGNLLWNITAQAGSDYSGLDVSVVNDDVFVVGEYMSSSGWQTSLLKYHANGTRIWQGSWGGEGHCRPSGLTQTLNAFYVPGTTSGWLSDNDEGFLIRFHQNGEAAPGPVQLYDPGNLNTNGIFNVSWTRAHDTDGYIIGYELQLATSATFTWYEISWTTTQNHFIVQDLTSGFYFFRVRARDNTALFGPWSNIHGINVTILFSPTINPWLAPVILLVGAGIMIMMILILTLYRWRKESLD